MTENAIQSTALEKPRAICGARTRRGKPCKGKPMENGRCRMHGGTNPGRPVTVGLYSVKHKQSLEAKITRYLDAPIDDLTHELALLRALLQDLLDKITESPNAKDRHAITLVVSEIRQTASAINKIRTNTALTGQEIQLFVLAMSGILKKYVPADDQPAAINELRTAINPR